MPIVKTLEDKMPLILPMTGRSKGMHVSRVIHDLCIKLGHYKDLSEEERNPAYLELGNIFEYAQIQRLKLDNPDRYVDLGEIELEGIFGTPDLYDIIDDILEEIKFSFISSRHEPGSKKFWKYEVQMMSYCYMFKVFTSRLRICHVMGNYKGSGPVYRTYQYQFSKSELVENWLMIKSHARTL